MKASRAKSGRGGFTLIELLAVMVILAVLMALLMPTRTDHKRVPIVLCINHQKQLDLGLIMFKDDHADKFPWQVSEKDGGSLEAVDTGLAFPNFRPMAVYIGNNTEVLVCPADGARTPAASSAQITDTNLSYFLNLDSVATNASILSGDRHLEVNGKKVGHGQFTYTTNMTVRWTSELHGKVRPGPTGVLGFNDGHVEVQQREALDLRFREQPGATNRMMVP
jgi:prepilin-type N-terminal cleavage/methylation domain-containing protein